MNWSGFRSGSLNFLSCFWIPWLLSFTSIYFDPNLVEVVETGIELWSIVVYDWDIYSKMLFSPEVLFNPAPVEWNTHYLLTALSFASFTFSFLIPSREFTANRWFSWLIKIPMSKIMDLISRTSVLLVTLVPYFIYFVIFLVAYLIGCLFFKYVNFLPYLMLLTYSICTLYITFSFILLIEHVMSLAWGHTSILKTFEEVADRHHQPTERVIRRMGYLRKVNSNSYKSKLKRFETKHSRKSKESGSILFGILLGYQKWILILIFMGMAYPFYCLVRSYLI